jgi:zinc-ribbon domain
MFCNKCGARVEESAPYCANCGAVTGTASPAVNYGESKLARRLSLLTVFWTIYGILQLFRAAAAHFFARAARFSWWSGPDWSQWAGPWVFAWVVCWALIGAALAFATAWGLHERQSWGRGVAIVAAVFGLIHPLLGTVLGVYTLVVMLSADAAEQYSRLARV